MDTAIETAVRKLGYREAKNLQAKSIKEFVSGNDVFFPCLLAMGKRYVMLVCL